jgi:hypothetical protein
MIILSMINLETYSNDVCRYDNHRRPSTATNNGRDQKHDSQPGVYVRISRFTAVNLYISTSAFLRLLHSSTIPTSITFQVSSTQQTVHSTLHTPHPHHRPKNRSLTNCNPKEIRNPLLHAINMQYNGDASKTKPFISFFLRSSQTPTPKTKNNPTQVAFMSAPVK